MTPRRPDFSLGLPLREVPGCFACGTCGFTTENRSASCPACRHEGGVPTALAVAP